MQTINCYIPLKLRLRGEPGEDDWATLEDVLVVQYTHALKRSLMELTKSHFIEQQMLEEVREPFAPERVGEEGYLLTSYKGSKPTRVPVHAYSTETAKTLSHPFILIRPVRLLWQKQIAIIREDAPLQYTVGVGCLPNYEGVWYRLEGQIVLRSRDTGEEILYTYANHKANFPGKPFLSQVYTDVSRIEMKISVLEISKLKRDGSFTVHNFIELKQPLPRLKLYLRLSTAKGIMSKISTLTLESMQGPNELISICKEALQADIAAKEASQRAKAAGEKLEAMRPEKQMTGVGIVVGQLGQINYYLAAVGLRLDEGGFLHLVSEWTSPDEWRWYSRNSIWNYAISWKALREWTARNVYNWLKEDRDRYLSKERPPLPFLVFIGELRRFEDSSPAMTLDEEIRAVRRAAHEQNIPFDPVIGVPAGRPEEYSTGEVGGLLQFFKDHKTVSVSGRTVNIYHLVVGLEALPMDRPDVVLRLPVIGELQTGMESAAAATWAGDVGSALADWRVGVDKAREPKGHLMKQLDHYWATRAAKDLDSDIEAWSVSQARKSLPTNLRRLSDMLLYYYSGVKTGEKLRNAFREFAKYYSSSGSTRMDVLRIRKQIVEFAHMWLLKRMREGYQPRYRETDFDWAADELTSRFLIYIEDRM